MLKRKVTIILALVCLAAGAGWWMWTVTGPAPPVPTTASLGPEVSRRIVEAADAVRRRPRDGRLRVSLGMIYESHGLFSLAVDCYEQALAQRTSRRDPKVWLRLAMAREHMGATDLAREDLLRAIELRQDYAPLHWRLGLVLLEMGHVDEAETHFRRAGDLDPSDQATWFGLARTLLQQGKVEQAASLLERLARGPHEAYARSMLANAYQRLGREAEAESLGSAPTRPPVWRDAWTDEMLAQRVVTDATVRMRAEHLCSEGRFAEALPQLLSLAAKAPDDVDLLNLLAAAYIETGAPTAGIETLRRAVRLSPEDFHSRVNLTQALLRLRPVNADLVGMALEHARVALELDPQSSLAYRLVAQAHLLLGEQNDAVHPLKEAYRRDTRQPATLMHAAVIEIDLGRYAEAFETLTWLQKDHPNAAAGHLLMARVQVQLDMLAEAESSLARAERLGGLDAEQVESVRAELARRHAIPSNPGPAEQRPR